MVAAEETEPFTRVRGAWLLIGLIALGMGVPAYLLWMVPQLEARRDRVLAEAPSEPEGRLELWFEYGQPRILEALQASRFSSRQPWLVSHVLRPTSPDEPPEIWGIDFSDLGAGHILREGLAVRVVFPAPTLLGRDVLVGDNALGVAVYDRSASFTDPRLLARNRLDYALKRVREGLGKDIPEARLSIEIGGLEDASTDPDGVSEGASGSGD